MSEQIKIGALRETVVGERRITITPDVAGRYQTLGAELLLEKGIGTTTFLADAAFPLDNFVASGREVLQQADIVLKVQPPSAAELAAMKEGSVLIGLLQPYADTERVKALQAKKITAFAMELLPRITRAQSMDILSSQGAIAGYQCVLIAAARCPKFFPMLTYAAGTIRPARVLVIGAGVAGLQAIATARRLGAVVEAYDVRPETREQIESLGAKFVDTGVAAVGAGGYARELTDEEKRRQTEKLARAVAQCDALITTAAIPGKRAPEIISADMVAAMKAGAIIVDMAAETGGNVAGTVVDEKVRTANQALIMGPSHITSRMPVHASEMIAKNLFNFISPFIREGTLTLDWNDEVLADTCLTHAGEIRHEGVRQALGL
ncbi:MAG: NAD(P) transhydrogenase subunit alpha [Betaproteobacteria bacterium]|nr:NAD(P) transhydrogenase subunit alpha [Betaproteobacteria bacterium]